MDKQNLLHSFEGGKHCSTNEALMAAARVLEDPECFTDLFKGLSHERSLVRMRSAYAVSLVADVRPDLLQPLKNDFFDRLAAPDNSHLARACMIKTLPHLQLSKDDIGLIKDMLLDFLHSNSSIVKTFSLQLLADFADHHPDMRSEVMPLLWDAVENGTPAMRARTRKLLKGFSLPLSPSRQTA